MSGFAERLNKIDNRVEQLEDWRHESDKRFEAFMARIDMYIAKTDERIAEDRERMDRMDKRMDKFEETVDALKTKMDNMLIAFGVGIATIVVTILLSK